MRACLLISWIVSTYFLTGCIGVAGTNGNGYYYGGGGITLFVVILALGLIFGRRKR
jgi:hypothetical protein